MDVHLTHWCKEILEPEQKICKERLKNDFLEKSSRTTCYFSQNILKICLPGFNGLKSAPTGPLFLLKPPG